MKHLVKLLAIVCLFCVALVAKAQLNGTYWAPNGAGRAGGGAVPSDGCAAAG